jgi:hypothetical protein
MPRRDGLADLAYERGLGLHFVGVGATQVGIDVRAAFINFRRVVGVQVGEQGFDGIEPLQAAPSGFFNCFLGFLLAHRIPHAECLARLIEAATLS